MVLGETNTIGVVVTDISSSFFSSVVRGISEIARAEGFEVLLGSTGRQGPVEDRTIDVFIQKRVAGLIVAPSQRSEAPGLRSLARLDAPTVLIDSPSADAPEATVVSLDHEASSRLAVNALADAGHRDIAIVTAAGLKPLVGGTRDGIDRSFMRPAELRLVGFVEALHDRGLDLDPARIITASPDQEGARAAVCDRLASGRRPTAIFATDAWLSSGTYQGLQDLGLTVPDDIAFVGFDDQEWCTMVRPQISVVTQPQYDLGAAAARMLVAQIRGHSPERDRIRMPASFISRSSISPLPT